MNRAFHALRRAGEFGSLRAIIVAVGLAATFTQADALGLGRSLTASSLGQSLNLVVPVRLDPDEQLTLECVTAQVQAGDAQIPAPLIHVLFDTGKDGTLRALRVTTVPRIEEPVVTVDLTLGCPRPLTRQFVVFVDPPIQTRLAQVEPAPTTQAAPAPAIAADNTTSAPASVEVHPKPAADHVAAKHRASPDASKVVLIPDASVLVAATQPGGKVSAKPLAVSKKRKAQTASQTAKASEGRLRLDAAAKLVPTQAAPAASGVLMEAASAVVSLPASAAASSSVGLSETLAQAAPSQPPEVIRKEARNDADFGDSRMPTVRTLWRAAQQGSPFALSFGLMVLILIAGLVYLWRFPGQETRRRELAWRNAREPGDHSPKPETQAGRDPAMVAPATSVTRRSEAGRPLAAAATRLHGKDPTSVLMDTLEALRKPPPAPHEQTQAFVSIGKWADYEAAKFPSESAAPDRPSMSSPSASAATRAVSVEELIDLEQQAEFCVALSQDDEAIALLQDHVRSTGGSSVLPYLKLLEIYKRRGDQSSYAALRSAFSQRFGAAPPSWEGDLSSGAGLEAYTSVLDRIQHAWNDFGSSMALVQHLLIPPHDGGAGMYTVASSLSLPACLDLLLLYSVARDLSAHEVQGNQVDVFLPLDQAGSSPLATSMMATLPRPLWVRPGAQVELDLDLSVGDSAPGRL